MRLRRLYCNQPQRFGPIAFVPGLNVVLGEIRDPDNHAKSTHNLGKTTLAKVIDFCLCRGKTNDFFLFKHEKRFSNFVFFLEVETVNTQFVTIRRSVESGTKLSLRIGNQPVDDMSASDADEWDHFEVGFDTGKQLLDGILSLTAVKPWSFRIPVSYALRTQGDFSDVFQLAKHRGKHRDWKPYIAHILGFSDTLVAEGYQIEEKLQEEQSALAALRRELGADDVSLDELQGRIELKTSEVKVSEEAARTFDFGAEEAAINLELVDSLDEQIGRLNSERYRLTATIQKIAKSLEREAIQFRPDAAKKLFDEAGVVFPDQLVHDFEALIRFNREVSTERVSYLKEELASANVRLDEVAADLKELNLRRQQELRFLEETDSLEKFRELSRRIVELKNDLESLRRQQAALQTIRDKEKTCRNLKRQLEDHAESLASNVEQTSSDTEGRYSRIRGRLAEFCQRIIGHKALLTTRVNNEGHIEFDAKYLDASDIPTSEDEGKSYQQALCGAFDLALTEELLDQDFLRFVYHDGLLEGLDNRVKGNIVDVLRELADEGVQQILTVIESDLPFSDDGERMAFNESEVVLKLHDGGDDGRLFRMKAW